MTSPNSIRSGLWNASDPTAHVAILVLSVMAVFVARALDVSRQSQVVIPGVNVALPGLCTYRQLVGHDCPGCGLTRSFVSFAHGDAAGAWSYNVVCPVFFVLVLFQIPFRALQIWRLKFGRTALRLCSELWIIGPLWLALLAQWLVRSMVPSMA